MSEITVLVELVPLRVSLWAADSCLIPVSSCGGRAPALASSPSYGDANIIIKPQPHDFILTSPTPKGPTPNTIS